MPSLRERERKIKALIPIDLQWPQIPQYSHTYDRFQAFRCSNSRQNVWRRRHSFLAPDDLGLDRRPVTSDAVSPNEVAPREEGRILCSFLNRCQKAGYLLETGRNRVVFPIFSEALSRGLAKISSITFNEGTVPQSKLIRLLDTRKRSRQEWDHKDSLVPIQD